MVANAEVLEQVKGLHAKIDNLATKAQVEAKVLASEKRLIARERSTDEIKRMAIDAVKPDIDRLTQKIDELVEAIRTERKQRTEEIRLLAESHKTINSTLARMSQNQTDMLQMIKDQAEADKRHDEMIVKLVERQNTFEQALATLKQGLDQQWLIINGSGSQPGILANLAIQNNNMRQFKEQVDEKIELVNKDVLANKKKIDESHEILKEQKASSDRWDNRRKALAGAIGLGAIALIEIIAQTIAGG